MFSMRMDSRIVFHIKMLYVQKYGLFQISTLLDKFM